MFRLGRSAAGHGTLEVGQDAAKAHSAVMSERILSVLTIIFVSALSYTPFIPWLGYYWDDWLMVWVGHAQGAEGLATQMAWDRPFHGLLFSVTYRLIGDNVVGWHIAIFVLLVISALLLLWVLRLLWPRQPFLSTSVALLYAVYPGFLGMASAQIFHGHYIVLSLGFLSLGMTIKAQQTTSKEKYIPYTILAMATGAVYLFIYELFISFEVLRILIIFYIAWRQKAKTGRQTLVYTIKRFLPYMAIIALFGFWRVFLFHGTRETTNLGLLVSEYASNPVGHLLRIPADYIRDLLDAIFYAWSVPAQNRGADALQGTLLASAAFGLLGGLAVILYERRARRVPELTHSAPRWASTWARDVVVIGTITAAMGILPVTLANMDLKLLYTTDRFTLHSVVGIAMLVAGAVSAFVVPRARPWAIGLLVGISVLTHFNNQNYFRNIWNEQKDLWWQMSWRVPDLQPQTNLVVGIAARSWWPSDTYDVWAPANFIYAPEASDEPEIYGIRLTESVADKLVRNTPIEYKVLSSIRFETDSANALILETPTSDSCLHVVDGANPQLAHDAPGVLSWAAPTSHIDRIITDAPPPSLPKSIFGSEPAHTWCYYYEKADLARQIGDFQQVAALGDEARSNGFEPDDGIEWLPFIESYASLGRCQDALDLTNAMIALSPTLTSTGAGAACQPDG